MNRRPGFFPDVKFGHAGLSPQGFIAPNNGEWTVPARHRAGFMLHHQPGPVVAAHAIPPVMKVGQKMTHRLGAILAATPAGGGVNGS